MKKYICYDSGQYFAFNVCDVESAAAIMDAAAQAGSDIILQTSMNAFEQLEKEEFRSYVKSYAKKKQINVYLHLDHCRRMELIHEAVACGWDSVMIDASDRPLCENIRLTNEVTDAVRKNGVLVEAEVGRIYGQEDEINCAVAGIASIADVKEFIKNTDVDMIAAAVGTVHGFYTGIPEIHYDIIRAAAEAADIPFVIHGGSGLDNEILRKLLSHENVKKINLSTEVKQAYRQGIEESMRLGYMEKQGFDPLKVRHMIQDAIRNMAVKKLELAGKGLRCENDTCP